MPFGLLPASDCESPALPLSADGDPRVVTPSFGPERNSELQRVVLAIDREGSGRGTFEISATGVNAAELSARMVLGRDKKERRLESWLDLNSLTVTSVSSLDAAAFADKASITGELTAKHLVARSSGNISLIRLLEFAPRWLHALPPEPRQTPFAYLWRDALTGEFEISLPPGARATAVPPRAEFDNPFFTYTLGWTNLGSTVKVQRKLVRKVRVIAPAQFEAFRAAVAQAHIAEARAAVVRFDGPEAK